MTVTKTPKVSNCPNVVGEIDLRSIHQVYYTSFVIFQSRLALVKTTVDKTLADFFIRKKQEAKKIDPHCVALVDQVESLTMRGGKRTRAFLVWLGFHSVIARSEATKQSHTKIEIASPSEWTRNDILLSAMMALELFHSFALIHDDIIDGDTTRRGGPTVHTQVGTNMAILAGDLALVWADELMGEAVWLSLRAQRSNLNIGEIAASPTAPRNDMGTWKLYQRMKQEVIFGQSLDVMEEHMKIGISKQLIDVYKTAWYSVIRPLQIGAAIAGADEKTIASFVPYGLVVGEAYQLRDDFLDGAISEEEFQKKAKKLVVPKSATILFTDFARYVLTRQS